ncbi:MAG: hypothetical protein R8P61_06425 [Bacteroidia bacterium]|nr:hypothetical protein [Bacteroidia bacterium]
MKNYYLNLFLILLFAVAFSSCKSTKATASKAKKYTPAGTWEYMITGIPDGDQSGTMTIMETTDGMSGSIASDAGETDLEDLVIEDNVLTATFSVQGYDIEMKGTFEGDTYKGNISVAGYEFPVTATRKM